MDNGFARVDDLRVGIDLYLMNICVFGCGAIGSVLAHRLAKAGHRITVVARGERLEQLKRDQAVVLSDGDKQPVTVCSALGIEMPYDLVMVTMFESAIPSVLPALRESKAKKIMFMFNTFEPIAPLRDAVGAERFHFGFPAGIFSKIDGGRVHASVRAGTTVDDETWAQVLRAAKIPTAVEADMHSWLRAHAAMVIPLMLSGAVVAKRTGGLTWAESRLYAVAYRQGMEVVKKLGHPIRPAFLGTLANAPLLLLTFVMWAFNKTEMQKQLGRMGTAEPVTMLEQMTRAAPGQTSALLAIKP